MYRFTVPRPVDLLASLRPLVASAHDPTIRLRPDGVVRASRTPLGPATLEIRKVGERHFEADAAGPGRPWAIEAAPALVGAMDELDGFDPAQHPAVARADRRCPGLRVVRTGRVEDVLVPTILAQRVSADEAGRAWTRLVRRWGEPAPGPHGLRLAPAADRLSRTPYWGFHALGVERSRAERVTSACRHLPVLQATLDRPHAEAAVRAAAVPGIGPWSAALLLRVGAGHADAVEVGDHWVKHQVCWNLAGEARGSDERMLELLAPFAGHRGRVIRLLVTAGRPLPRFAARRPIVRVDEL